MTAKFQSPASTTGLKHGLFSASEARFDRWCELGHAAEALAATTKAGKPSTEARAQIEQLLAALESVESLHAYPGDALMAALKDLLERSDFIGFARLAIRISKALLNGTYRRSSKAWKAGEEADGESNERLLKDYFEGEDLAKPYFEVLIVSDDGTPEQIRQVRNEWRKLRRSEDPFVYEIVVAASFEDAVLGVVLNPNIQAIIIQDNFRFQTNLHAPLLREYLQEHLKFDAAAIAPQDYGVTLAKTIRSFRPELDVYLVVDRGIEKMASHLDSKNIRRIFYGIEDLMELHLAVFEGVNDRYDTPYFNNLKNYARKPMGTFHALPIARGKSVFKSHWIRDFGYFYGTNIFLAESSATTGGLDSLLEPTGNIKVAQEKAARAFGAQKLFFGTNGTSTSNKIAVQAIVRPGDIVLVDRNCHKSHHYGLVLCGGQPLYVEAYPLMQYSMYGGVPLRTIKQTLLNPSRRRENSTACGCCCSRTARSTVTSMTCRASWKKCWPSNPTSFSCGMKLGMPTRVSRRSIVVARPWARARRCANATRAPPIARSMKRSKRSMARSIRRIRRCSTHICCLIRMQ